MNRREFELKETIKDQKELVEYFRREIDILNERLKEDILPVIKIEYLNKIIMFDRCISYFIQEIHKETEELEQIGRKNT